MKNKKVADRTKYNPDGRNEYSAPKEKPPRRYDPGKRHHYKDDPLDSKDDHSEKEMNRKSQVDMEDSNLKETAKKIARIRIARNVAISEKGFNLNREGIDNFKFKEKGIKSVAKTYKHMADAFLNMTRAINTFTSCKSSEVSPDGKLGGKGYIQPIRDIRSDMAQCLNVMSDLIDTFHDEVNSPYWKRVTVEDHPVVKEILQEAEEKVDKAEDLEGNSDPRDPENIVLSEDEKSKVLNILKTKGHF